jgi:hypothetical protein
MKRPILVLLVLAGLAAACGGDGGVSAPGDIGPPSPPDWTTPVRIDATATLDRAPVLGVSPAGEAVAVWMHEKVGGRNSLLSDGLRASRFIPGRGWSPVATLPESVARFATAVALDDRAAAVVIGSFSEIEDKGRRHVWSTRSTPDSAWSDPELVPVRPGEAIRPLVVRPRTSLAVAAWLHYEDGNTAVWSSLREGEGSWTTAQSLDANGQDVNSLDLVTDGRGRALATWYEATGPIGGAVWAALFDSGGWNAPVRLAETGTFPVAAFVGSGAVVLWSSPEGTMVGTSGDGLSWSSPQDGPSARLLTFDLRVVFEPAGNALAVWRQQNAQAAFELWGSYYDRQRGWTDPQLLGASPFAEGEVVFDGRGRGLVLRSTGGLVCAQIYTPAASWTEPPRCLGPGAEVRAGADGIGNVTAVWTNAGAIWFSRLEAPR